MGGINDVSEAAIIGVVVIAIIIIVFYFCAHPVYKNVYYKIKVTDKTRVVKHSSSHYLIFGKFSSNGKIEPLADSDSFMRWKFNSSEIYGQLQKGKTYCVRTNWMRAPFLSWYKNILAIEPMSKC